MTDRPPHRSMENDSKELYKERRGSLDSSPPCFSSVRACQNKLPKNKFALLQQTPFRLLPVYPSTSSLSIFLLLQTFLTILLSLCSIFSLELDSSWFYHKISSQPIGENACHNTLPTYGACRYSFHAHKITLLHSRHRQTSAVQSYLHVAASRRLEC